MTFDRISDNLPFYEIADLYEMTTIPKVDDKTYKTSTEFLISGKKWCLLVILAL